MADAPGAGGADAVEERLSPALYARLCELLNEAAGLVRLAGVRHAAWRVAGSPPYVVRFSKD